MNKQDNIQALLMIKQSKVSNKLDKAIELATPILTQAHRITERELKKIDNLLKENKLNDISTGKEFSEYTATITFYCRDRSIDVKMDDYTRAFYIKDSTRVIYINAKDRTITAEDLKRYIRNDKILTYAKAMQTIKKYNTMQDQIRELKSKIAYLPQVNILND